MKKLIFLYTAVISVMTMFMFTGCLDSTDGITDITESSNGCAELIPDTGLTFKIDSADTAYIYYSDFTGLLNEYPIEKNYSVIFTQDSITVTGDANYANSAKNCSKIDGITYVTISTNYSFYYAFDSTESWLLEPVIITFYIDPDETPGIIYNIPNVLYKRYAYDSEYTTYYKITHPENCPLIKDE